MVERGRGPVALPQGGARVTFAVRLEVEGSKKPALLASVNYAYLP